ncbi:MAG: hypothetical protein B7X86_03435 [Sphingobacteriales bacterium 17-39-43]|uniref:hypothetical protein n=1 Tax=Daejeonella sp. TaxID=2805397 RepID=UPI000BDAF595|nr:hypothetical protein [Daejeonella sp.]OYZ32397.1 MAG: hypothetical protein B7Y24_04260 [Sphingobacteriales bacterium 16-39-50]OZA25761.1 MAG: hypothetical protein B7X86_03435 [Sphingobacteriales bacterium 17-39-43]HQS04288.1 hypothetical protein [Daejeonella sp.]HQT22050.1 hypothetical protein [Daejeonella sp.]HQT57357.1 hypothetical protein [Daejeonella sp.]
MDNEWIIAFLIGILTAFLSEYLLYLFKTRIYEKRFVRRRFKKILGTYSHKDGTVEIVHLRSNYFQAIGKEKNGTVWISNLQYLGNTVFVGVYDWKPTSNLNDWGEHHLHVLPSGDISVIWINKSIDIESRGRLIWKKLANYGK